MNTLLHFADPRKTTFHTEASSFGKILYAEDDPILRQLSATTLRRAGYAVVTVEDGFRAWEALQSDGFDLFITDNDMPGLTGMELVAKLRVKRMKIPVMVASGSAYSLEQLDCKWLGIARWLQKPFGPDELMKAVGQHFRGAVPAGRQNHAFFQEVAHALDSFTPLRHWGLNE